MAELFIVFATLILLWMAWRLYQAKRYNRFIDWLKADIKPLLSAALEQELIEQRNQTFPNKQAHIDATVRYYSQYPVRIFEAAVARQIIAPQWFANKENKRHAQHLLFIQALYRQTVPSISLALANERSSNNVKSGKL